MIRGLNKLQLIGNLGRDPEMKYTQQGTPVTSFSVAVSRGYTGPDGQQKEETEWFRVVAWQKLAEECHSYLHKGSRVYIEGRLQSREWQGQDGQPQKSMEVVASEMLMLDSRQTGVTPASATPASATPASAPPTGPALETATAQRRVAAPDVRELDF